MRDGRFLSSRQPGPSRGARIQKSSGNCEVHLRRGLRPCMKRRDYRGHPRALIEAWFLPEEDLGRYDPKLYYFDPDAATRVLDFFKLYCTHVEGEWAGRPLIPEQWQYRTLRD